jgi:two-component system nitrogen regulation sensor histidine kinase NtrY
VVENAAGVGRLYIQSVESGIRSQVMAMANDVDQPDAAQGLREQPERFAGYLRDQAQARGFASAYLLDAKGRPIARGEPPRAPPFEAPSSGDLADAGKGAIPISLFERAGLLRSLVKLNSYPGAYLYVSQPIDEGMLGQLRTYEQAVIAYRETERRRAGLQTLFVLSYLATAWLVLLGAVWVGLSIAAKANPGKLRRCHMAVRQRSLMGSTYSTVQRKREHDASDPASPRGARLGHVHPRRMRRDRA